MDEITIGDKIYISTKRAAKITGYAKDYVGQLCREGRVEARLVGRNWYVLETSIREHRFGQPETVVSEAPIPESKPINPASTWQAPQYVPETPVFVPDLAPKEEKVSIGSPAIADMQSAWREWFEEKKLNTEENTTQTVQEMPATAPAPIENPSNLLADHVEEESVPLNRLEETSVIHQETYAEPVEEHTETLEEETEVSIHKSYTRHEAEQVVSMNDIPVVNLTLARHVATTKPKQTAGKSGSGVLRALLIVVALAAVLLAVVGTGNAERLLSGTSFNLGPQKAILDFIGGTSTYKNSL